MKRYSYYVYILGLLSCFWLFLPAVGSEQQLSRQDKIPEKQAERQCPEPLVPSEKDPNTCICLLNSARAILSRPLEHAQVALKPYGYIKLDAWYDTRQVHGTREDHLLLFPEPYRPDKFCRDINAVGQFNMSIIETRFGILFIGPRWGDLAFDANLETDFRGNDELTIAMLRIRDVYGRISWPTGSFLYGQYTHPLVIRDVRPYTVSYNRGVPMEPRARVPQVLIVERVGKWEYRAAASSQLRFKSPGPFGPSTEYLRNARLPNLTFGVRYYFEPINKTEASIGAVFDFKRLVPRLVSDKNIKVRESINSVIAQVYGLYIRPPMSIKAKILYAQNGAEQLLISGYTVETRDPLTDFRTYANTAAFATWVEGIYTFHCDKMELGLFLGYTKNLGARRPLFVDPCTGEPIVYTFQDNIARRLDYVFRIAPRWVWALDPLRVGIELEYTQAAFGKLNKFARPVNPKPVANMRFLAGLYYFF